MSLLERLSHSQRDDARCQVAQYANQEVEPAIGRYEPNALEAQRIHLDPYVAWLEQRDAIRERDDRSRIRCVYRYRGTATRISSAGRS